MSFRDRREQHRSGQTVFSCGLPLPGQAANQFFHFPVTAELSVPPGPGLAALSTRRPGLAAFAEVSPRSCIRNSTVRHVARHTGPGHLPTTPVLLGSSQPPTSCPVFTQEPSASFEGGLGGLTRRRRRRPRTAEAEVGGVCPSEAGGGRKDPPHGRCGSTACGHLQSRQGAHFCCLKPRTL